MNSDFRKSFKGQNRENFFEKLKLEALKMLIFEKFKKNPILT